MKTISKKLAFSLVELSVVIVVIGILVLGVANGSRILGQARLKSARDMTIGSVVNATEGLYLWLDATSENSFDANIQDGDPISNWYGINSQSISQFNFTQSGIYRPTYRSLGMNGLPSVEFDGVNDCIQNSNFSFPYGSYTIFIVFKSSVNNVSKTLFGTDSTGNGAPGLLMENSATGIVRFLHRFPYSSVVSGDNLLSPSNILLANTNYVLSLVRNLPNANVTFRLNNANTITGAATISSFNGTALQFKIGCLTLASRQFQGYINELIIFNRALNNYDRQLIEQYLSTKWGIKLN